MRHTDLHQMVNVFDLQDSFKFNHYESESHTHLIDKIFKLTKKAQSKGRHMFGHNFYNAA